MRAVLLAAVLAAMTADAARADELPATIASSHELIEVLPGTGRQPPQALLYDRDQDMYVVVRAGDEVGGLRVTSVSVTDDQVVLARGEASVVLTLSDVDPGAATTSTSRSGESLLDPYAGLNEVQASPPPAPATTPTPIAVATVSASAPVMVATVPAPVGAPATTTTVPAPVTTPAPATTATVPAPVTATAPATVPAPHALSPLPTLRRAELDAALADFSGLSRDLDAHLGPDGATLVRVAPGSLAHRIGLRNGDRVVAVDGHPLRSLDDAAALYARLAGASRVEAEVVRGAERLALRVQVTK